MRTADGHDLAGSVIVLTGVMAAGKSTVAQALAERLPRSAHVRGDVFRRMVVGGRAEPRGEPSGEALAQLRLRYRLAGRVADGYAAAGFAVVLQDIAVGRLLPELLDGLASRPRYLVVLAPRPDVVAQREAARSKTGYADDGQFAALDRALRDETPRLGWWLDSSELSVAQTVDAVLAHLPAARLD